MAQDDTAQHVLCPECGGHATRHADGAIYCLREHALVREYTGRPDRAGARAEPPALRDERPATPSPDRVPREYGAFNILLLVFVIATLVAAAITILFVV